MNTSRRLALVVAFGALGTASAFAVEPEVGPPPRLAATEFTSKEFKFSAKFPGKATEQKQPGPLGTTMSMYAVESKTGVMAIAVADLPLPANMTQEQLDAALDGAMNGQVNSADGKLKESKKITLGEDKHQGRQFTATITKPAKGQVHTRLVLVGNRLYQVMVMGTNDYVGTKEAAAFLESFRLIE